MSNIGPVPSGEIALYEAPDGQIRLDVRLEQETVWLSQAQMAELFGRERSVITKHLRNVFAKGELAAEGTSAKLAQVQTEGGRTVTREVDHYSLDGNKRIGSLLFLEYLRLNGALLRSDSKPRFADNALVALALLVAESDARHKLLMTRVILNLLGDDGA